MTNAEIVRKLIGVVTPIGETNTDNERFENLKAMCELVDELVADIVNVSSMTNRYQEYSIKRAAQFATDFLNKILITK